MIPIIKNEIWGRRLSLLAYCGIGLGLLLMYIALFPSLQASSAQLEKVLQAYPKGMFDAFGIQDLTFSTIDKFLAIELFTFTWPILAIVFTMSRAGNSLAGEIERRTMGIYLSLPISRLKIYFSKYIAQFISVALFISFTILIIIPLTWLFGQTSSIQHVLEVAALAMFFMSAILSAIFCLSALLSDRSRVYMIAGGLLLVMYVANVVAALKPSWSWLHHESIFYYFNTQELLSKGQLKPESFVIFFVASVVFVAIGALIFNKRDIAN